MYDIVVQFDFSLDIEVESNSEWILFINDLFCEILYTFAVKKSIFPKKVRNELGIWFIFLQSYQSYQNKSPSPISCSFSVWCHRNIFSKLVGLKMFNEVTQPDQTGSKRSFLGCFSYKSKL